MRLGIFGGSFDPVHNAHLAMARACQEQAKLDEVWFTPAAIQPLKQRGPRASHEQRVEMLRLATEHEPTWRVSTMEIDRGGFSYTAETLRQIREELPDARLYFLMGADAVPEVPQWRNPDVMFQLATPLVARRGGLPEPDLSPLMPLCAAENQPQLVDMPAMDTSSTDIRRRVAAGQAIDALIPTAVAHYIVEHGLYRLHG